MAINKVNLTLTEANDQSGPSITIQHGDGSAYDGTGCHFNYVLYDRDDSVAIMTTTDLLGGVVVESANPLKLHVRYQDTDTAGRAGTWHHELQMVDAVGNKYTVHQGAVLIEDTKLS